MIVDTTSTTSLPFIRIANIPLQYNPIEWKEKGQKLEKLSRYKWKLKVTIPDPLKSYRLNLLKY